MAVSILLYKYTKWKQTKCIEETLDGNFTRMLPDILDKSWKQHPMKQQPYDRLHNNHPTKTNTTYKKLLEKQKWTHKRCSSKDPYTQTGQCWPTSKHLITSYLFGHKNTNWERWMIGTDGERESGKSVLTAQLEDDDNGLIMLSFLSLYFLFTAISRPFHMQCP